MFRQFQTKNRFSVEMVGARDDGWNMIDNLDNTCLEFNTKAEAESQATFCRAYVKRWGDIDLNSFPYSLDSALIYERETERPWETTSNQKGA